MGDHGGVEDVQILSIGLLGVVIPCLLRILESREHWVQYLVHHYLGGLIMQVTPGGASSLSLFLLVWRDRHTLHMERRVRDSLLLSLALAFICRGCAWTANQTIIDGASSGRFSCK